MADADHSQPFLAARNISKRFGPTQALDDVTVTFRKGEVHALMGENGAGKSTLGKIIAGLHRQDSGTVTIDGRELVPGDLDDAFAAGVRLVHQELAQCPNLSVAENLSLHDIPTGAFGLIDRPAMNQRAARLVHRLDPGIDVEAPLGLLSPGRRQICQIAASLDDGSDRGKNAKAHGLAKVIVFDEPTSSLSVAEADRLLEITRGLAAEGITIIYVSHRMGEIFQVCDRVSVLRDGKYIATNVIRDIDEPTLVEQMIGRRIATPERRAFAKAAPAASAAPSSGSNHAGQRNGDSAVGIKALVGEESHVPPPHTGRPLLEVKDVSSPAGLQSISLDVYAGEIVGVGGLVGCGRSELLNAVFGLDKGADGQVLVGGAVVDRSTPRGAIAAGIGYVPEDRRNQGLFFQLGIDENIVMPVMPWLASLGGIRSSRAERDLVAERVREFQVKAASFASTPGELSGGNQQKLLIARWMGRKTRVLLLDEPTRGIDVGTKAEIYKLIRKAADAGAAVLLVSSEMPELLALSDRILVMCEGRISGELSGDDMTQANILRLATANDSIAAAQAKAAGR
jgi:ABC-type sugar transport system ATPase subunit